MSTGANSCLRLNRRDVLAGLGVLALGNQSVLAEQELTVGFIYVGARDDFGYNNAHANAAAKVAQLPGVRVIEQERVPETDKVAVAMEAMIRQENAQVLFPTSYGYYDPYILELANKYPQVAFLHCGGAWRKGEDPLNIGSYLGHMHEGQHLAGVAAGTRANSAALGFVASFRYPSVLRNINAFALGAQRINPDLHVKVVFTGAWSDPVREAEAVNTMADQGIAVVGCSVDSARTVVATAQRRGIYSCGYNASAAKFGPDSYLTAAISDWGPHNIAAVQAVQQGNRPPNFYSGGLAEGLVTVDKANLAGEVAQQVDARYQELVTGAAIWQGPIYDNAGELKVAAGTTVAREDNLLARMNWFVRGVRA